MITTARTTSVIAKLSAKEPMRFGETDFITFNDFPKAEFVEEGADKASMAWMTSRGAWVSSWGT